MKYLGVNMTKDVKDLNTENYKTLLRKIKGLNKYRDSTCSWVKRLNIVKIPIVPKLIYRFSAISSKSQKRFCRT